MRVILVNCKLTPPPPLQKASLSESPSWDQYSETTCFSRWSHQGFRKVRPIQNILYVFSCSKRWTITHLGTKRAVQIKTKKQKCKRDQWATSWSGLNLVPLACLSENQENDQQPFLRLILLTPYDPWTCHLCTKLVLVVKLVLFLCMRRTILWCSLVI